MAEAVYILGTVISLICAALLLRVYLRSRTALLLWSSLCFIGLALDNILLLVDLYVVPSVDLAIARSACVLGALLILLYGLIWESR